MRNYFLLPHACKNIGWVILVPMTVLGMIYIFFPDADILYIDWMDEATIIGLATSMVMVAFSREKDEDEYTASIRNKHLALAFYIDLAILIVATLTINSFNYLNIIALQMFLALLIFIVTFNFAMWRLRKATKTL